jgi:hypothetical protein
MQWRDLGLRKYELEDTEWVILQQLRDVLKVCVFPNTTHAHVTLFALVRF